MQDLRRKLKPMLSLLEKEQGWYGSIYLERKIKRNYLADLKRTNVSDDFLMGVVFRIYDGYTLFEQATDDLTDQGMKHAVDLILKRVKSSKKSGNPTYYKPPSWGERLKRSLEKEITSQIPPNPKSDTEIHFGIRFNEDPISVSSEAHLEALKALLAKARQGTHASIVTYAATRRLVSIEEGVFIDREVNLSQTLYRMSHSLILMAGADRVRHGVGGLGGMECVEIPDSQIEEMLMDLKALKDAERIQPGRYRLLASPEISGVIAHEAFGHSQEGDTCARDRSKAWELYQNKTPVGNEHATILNNPAIFQNGDQPYAAWGSYFFDEEGWLAEEQVLLDKGILKAPMTNLTSAIHLGVPRTANGKREAWTNGVYTRQTNTYFSAGDRTLAQLLVEMKDGFLVTDAAGGMEDPKGMGIQVGLQFLREVKNGKLTGKLYKGPNGGDIQLTGYTPDVLNAIVAKSKISAKSTEPDQARHPIQDVGGCGKYHKESVYAGCGGPYMLLDSVTLG